MNILTFETEEWFHILDNSSTKTPKEWGNFESRIHQNMDRIYAVLEKSKLFALAESLGGVESLLEHRASVEGPDTKTPKNLIRVSVGLENIADLQADLAQALA